LNFEEKKEALFLFDYPQLQLFCSFLNAYGMPRLKKDQIAEVKGSIFKKSVKHGRQTVQVFE